MSVYTCSVDEIKRSRDRRTIRHLLVLAIAETAAELRCESELPGLAARLTSGRTTDYRQLTIEEAEQVLSQLA